MRAILASLAGIAAAQTTYYWRYPNYDSSGPDISRVTFQNVSQMEAACDAAPGCVGFNTDGYLKAGLTNILNGNPCDLYIRNINPAPGAGISLWPLPTDITTGSTTLSVSPSFSFTTSSNSVDLDNAFVRYNTTIFSHAAPPATALNLGANTITGVNVVVANTSVPLQLNVDESYTLNVPATGGVITITANTVYGAYHGLETMTQLIYWSPDNSGYFINSAPIVINDAPRFAWRGLLIDTSRHFQPLKYIYRVIDSLTYVKMNILHWHIVDWQAWPVQSTDYPLLWSGAWSYAERYTLADVATVVEYARQRGVRVVLEFDTPGHAGSVCTGYPELCPSVECTMPLNPAYNGTLPFIQSVLNDLASVSFDNYFHLGGDEVDTSCWTSTPSIVQWMNEHNLTADQTYEYFVQNVDKMAENINRFPVRWEEVWNHFGTQLDMDTIIHIWLNASTMVNVTNNGYKGIWSVDGLYYLDGLDVTWETIYNVDVLGGITNVSAQANVLGGEVEMWGETVDPSDILNTIWPRAAASAERLWSYDVVTNASAIGVRNRLADLRMRMTERGIPVAPIDNAVARSAPPNPGSIIFQ